MNAISIIEDQKVIAILNQDNIRFVPQKDDKIVMDKNWYIVTEQILKIGGSIVLVVHKTDKR